MIGNSSDPSGNEPSNFFPEKSRASAVLFFNEFVFKRFAPCSMRFAVCWSAIIGVNLRLSISSPNLAPFAALREASFPPP